VEANVREPISAPFSTPAFLKRHRNGCAGVGEPDLAPFLRNMLETELCSQKAGEKILEV
jgi:hypothetical protein